MGIKLNDQFNLQSVTYFPKGKIAHCLLFEPKTKTHYTVRIKDLNDYPTKEQVESALQSHLSGS